MSDQPVRRRNTKRWVAFIIAAIAATYLLTVVVNLLNEANMAFGFMSSQKAGIEQELTARPSTFSDTVLTARQISTMLSIAEGVSSLPSTTNRARATQQVLVKHLNAASMTLEEYRYVRATVNDRLRAAPSMHSRDQNDGFEVVLPRFQAVRSFFTKHLDSIALAPTR